MEHSFPMLSFVFAEKLNIEKHRYDNTLIRIFCCYSISNKQKPTSQKDNNVTGTGLSAD